MTEPYLNLVSLLSLDPCTAVPALSFEEITHVAQDRKLWKKLSEYVGTHNHNYVASLIRSHLRAHPIAPGPTSDATPASPTQHEPGTPPLASAAASAVTEAMAQENGNAASSQRKPRGRKQIQAVRRNPPRKCKSKDGKPSGNNDATATASARIT